jgi:hypothetical protein
MKLLHFYNKLLLSLIAICFFAGTPLALAQINWKLVEQVASDSELWSTFEFDARLGLVYHVQSSNDLDTWEPIGKYYGMGTKIRSAIFPKNSRPSALDELDSIPTISNLPYAPCMIQHCIEGGMFVSWRSFDEETNRYLYLENLTIPSSWPTNETYQKSHDSTIFAIRLLNGQISNVNYQEPTLSKADQVFIDKLQAMWNTVQFSDSNTQEFVIVHPPMHFHSSAKYFRIVEYSSDSNGDGINDEDELVGLSNPISNDNNFDGCPEPYALFPRSAVIVQEFILSSDINNDGMVDLILDKGLANAAVESGAPELVVINGTEFTFRNDLISNGDGDIQDPDKPQGTNRDDDVEPLIIHTRATVGIVDLNHPAKAYFSYFKDQLATLPIAFPYDLSNGPLPCPIYLRVSEQLPSQMEGALDLTYTKPGQSSKIVDKIPLTAVKKLGDTRYFHASADYIKELNQRFCLREVTYTHGSFLVATMLDEKALMFPIDGSRRPTGEEQLKGIDSVISKYPSIHLAINGNQCFFADDRIPVWAGINGQMTDKCHGRIFKSGALDAAVSSDNTDPTTSPKGSPLAGDDPLAGLPITDPNSRGGNYFAQVANGVKKSYKMHSGRVPVGSGVRYGMGGLSANAASRAIGAEVQAIGRLDAPVTQEKMIFTATQRIGGGSADSLVADAEASGVEDLPGGRAGEVEVLFLDGSTSVASAYAFKSDDIKTKVKGSKHNGAPYYYVNTYLLFHLSKPR